MRPAVIRVKNLVISKCASAVSECVSEWEEYTIYTFYFQFFKEYKNINQHNCFQHIIMISEGSCDTED